MARLRRAHARPGVVRSLQAPALEAPAQLAYGPSMICTLIHLYAQVAPEGLCRSEREATLVGLFAHADKALADPAESNPAVSPIAFIRRLMVGKGLPN